MNKLDKILTNALIVISVVLITVVCTVVNKFYSEDKDEFFEFDEPEKFAWYFDAIKTSVFENEPNYGINYRLNEIKKYAVKESILKSGSNQSVWIERGPGNVGGRTRGLIIDPDDENGDTWFAGSVGGGIWKTTNAGGSWINLTPDFPNLSTGCLAMANSNHDVMFAGTGELFKRTSFIQGDGIFKSVDHGNTWMQLESSINENFRYVNQIIIDPQNENHIYVATNNGIFESQDGGLAWENVFYDGKRIQCLMANPSDFSIIYATVNGGGIIQSINSGVSWNYIFRNDEGRIELDISKNNPQVIYALTEKSNVYISDNGGYSWNYTRFSEPDVQFLGEQGWYNNSIRIDPTNDERAFIGGIELYEVEITGSSEPETVYLADTTNTGGFLSFQYINSTYLGGILLETDSEEFVPFEIRFGPGITQKAHRFTVPEGSTSGVPDQNYSYKDYVSVPFEVWDTENNIQLMVSFRDQDNNGVFNLTEFDDNQLKGREYIYISSIDYNENLPSGEIAVAGGHTKNNIAFIWPVLAERGIWNPDNLPESKVFVKRTVITEKQVYVNKLSHWWHDRNASQYIHADIHKIEICEKVGEPFRVVVANDGGLAYSDDNGNTWNNPLNGYNTSQFYGIDKHPTEDRYIGGMQDNGSWFSFANPGEASEWKEATGGDGFDAVWHATNPNKMITSIYYNNLQASSNGGFEWHGLISDYKTKNSGEQSAPFITQIANDPRVPNRLFILGKYGISRSDDFGETWNDIDLGDEWRFQGMGQIAISESNPDIIWAGCQMTQYASLFVSTNGGITFNPVPGYYKSMGNLSGLATHPGKPETAYALFSFGKQPKILKTDNLGNSWTDISGFENTSVSERGFPDVAVLSLLVVPYDTVQLWAGTEIGLFVSKDDGASWKFSGNGLPAVSVWELKRRGNQVVAATHGRGIWTIGVDNLQNISAPELFAIGIAPSGKPSLKYSFPSIYDSVQVLSGDQVLKTMFPNGTQSERYLILNVDLSSVENLQLKAYKNSSFYFSETKPLEFREILDPVLTYENDFEGTTTCFSGEGFSIIDSDILKGKGIHSQHPYQENGTFLYYLNKPVIINTGNNESESLLSYKDIPMVEAGEPGAVFGDENFYDYVVLEATDNGIDWIPLEDGYDFSYIQNTASQYNITINENPVKELFTLHTINLQNYFQTNDTILFRFRLFSDRYDTGWGWVIDDLKIQSINSGTKPVLQKIDLQVFPNPCNRHVNIQMPGLKSGEVVISIRSMDGKEVYSVKKLTPEFSCTLNLPDLHTGFYLLEIRQGNLLGINQIIVDQNKN